MKTSTMPADPGGTSQVMTLCGTRNAMERQSTGPILTSRISTEFPRFDPVIVTREPGRENQHYFASGSRFHDLGHVTGSRFHDLGHVTGSRFHDLGHVTCTKKSMKVGKEEWSGTIPPRAGAEPGMRASKVGPFVSTFDGSPRPASFTATARHQYLVPRFITTLGGLTPSIRTVSVSVSSSTKLLSKKVSAVRDSEAARKTRYFVMGRDWSPTPVSAGISQLRTNSLLPSRVRVKSLGAEGRSTPCSKTVGDAREIPALFCAKTL
jgi:hypothetical protein